jgi:hypothetical protein
MARESREVWAPRVARWVESGLTAAEFASEVGVNARTLVYWKWKLGKEGSVLARVASKPASDERLSFVEVSASMIAPSAPIELVLGDLNVRVPDGFSAETLRGVLEVVRDAR